MEQGKIIIEATVAADARKAWDYYTQPEHITQWNFATDDWQCPRATNDLREGGTYSARMEAKDGSYGFDFEAVYDDVTYQKNLTYTLGDGRQVTTTFKETGCGTKVTTSFDPDTMHDLEMQRAGWQAILDNYKRHTESN